MEEKERATRGRVVRRRGVGEGDRGGARRIIRRMSLRSRLKWALGAYATLAALAWFTLDGKLRSLVLVVLAAFAAKSYIAVRRQEAE